MPNFCLVSWCQTRSSWMHSFPPDLEVRGVDKVFWAVIDLGSWAILQARVLCIYSLPFYFITKFQIIKWFSWNEWMEWISWSQDFIIGPDTVSIKQFVENPISGCALCTSPLLTSQVLAVSKKKSSPCRLGEQTSGKRSLCDADHLPSLKRVCEVRSLL
jgi:hypothetical protein